MLDKVWADVTDQQDGGHVAAGSVEKIGGCSGEEDLLE